MNHHTKLVGKIAHEVYESLGSGFSEDVYDHAMQVGLRLAGIEYESQKVVELKYRDHWSTPLSRTRLAFVETEWL